MEWSPCFVRLISFVYFIHGTVGVTTITNVTLIDGQTPNEGRVEYKRLDVSWASACGDGLGYNEAAVICRHLGYPGVNNYIAQWPFGMSASIAQERLRCNGDEENLAGCSSQQVSFCSDAGGVICYDSGYLGCYPFTEMALGDLQSPCEYGLDDSESLRISGCISLCRGTNTTYAYAGLYNGDTCLCGNTSTVISQSDRVEDSQCNSPCAGRNIERCGGASHIALFNISRYLRDKPLQLPSVNCSSPPTTPTTAVPEDISTVALTTVGTPTFAVSSQVSRITTSPSDSSAPSSLFSSTSSKSTSSFSFSSSSLPSQPTSTSISSSLPSQSSPTTLSSFLSTSGVSSGIVTIPPSTNLQSSRTSTQIFSTSGTTTISASEMGLAIALGIVAFLFVGAIVIFFIILRRRKAKKYETNVAHMNYSGSLDNSFFASRLSRQDLIPPDLNGGVSPRESVLMEGTPRDSIVFTNQNGHIDARWFAYGPAQHQRPLPNPHNRQSSHSESFNIDRNSPADRPSSCFAFGASQQSPTTPNSDGRESNHRESFNMDRWPRDSPADRPSSFFAPGVSQNSPTTPNSEGNSAREDDHRDSFHLNRPTRESIYENDSDPDDHVYERVMLDKLPRSQNQSSV